MLQCKLWDIIYEFLISINLIRSGGVNSDVFMAVVLKLSLVLVVLTRCIIA